MASKSEDPFEKSANRLFGLFVIVSVIASAFFSAAILLPAQSAEDANQRTANKYATLYAKEAGDEIESECGVGTPTQRHDCSQAKYDRAREGQRREYEVEANRDSAVWNEAMGRAAIIGGFYGAMTIALVFGTFLLQSSANRRAQEEFGHARRDAQDAAAAAERSIAASIKTAEAAMEQVKIARDTAYRQLRAYVDFNGVRWSWGEGNEIGSTPPTTLDTTLRNYGHTPASEVVYKISHSAILDGRTLDISKVEATGDLHNIAPTDELILNGDNLMMPEEVWDALKSGRAEFISHIVVTYTDAFEAKHTLKASFTNSRGKATHSIVVGSKFAD